MAEEVVHTRRTTGSGVAWAALVIALVALVVAWMAYNRTGTDLETKAQNNVNNAVDEAQGQR
jgi:hypothetical protein